MDLSVVIPTFRRPGPLGEALASVLSQGHGSLEVIVCDDSPDREARPVVERLGDPRVTYVAMDPPTGGSPSCVRNTGLRLSHGEAVHFLDDDDRVTIGAHRRMLRALADNPSVGVVFGRVRPFGDDPESLRRERHVFSTSGRRGRKLGRVGSGFLFVAHQLFAGPTMFVNSACMVRREVAERVGGYDEDLRVMEDIDFHTRCIRASGVVFLDEPVVEYRTGAPSLMNSVTSREVIASYQRMYDKYAREHGRLELRLAQLLAKGILGRL